LSRRAIEIIKNVVGTLKTDRHAYQPVRDAALCPLSRRISGVSHARGMFDRRLRIAKADRALDDLKLVHQGTTGREAAF
jgi:hypothetical protein